MNVNTFLSHRRSLATPFGEIAYTEFGAGPAALFVHGLGTSGALWRHVIEELSDTSRCIAVDLPAHGASPARDDMSVAALAEALADLGDSLGSTWSATTPAARSRRSSSAATRARSGRSPSPTASARATSRHRSPRRSSSRRGRARWRRNWSSSPRSLGRRTR
jgi:alpha/beta hydrolase fold